MEDGSPATPVTSTAEGGKPDPREKKTTRPGTSSDSAAEMDLDCLPMSYEATGLYHLPHPEWQIFTFFLSNFQ